MIEERVFEQLCINKYLDNLSNGCADYKTRKDVAFLMQEVIAENGITQIVVMHATDYDVISYTEVNISRLLAEMQLCNPVNLRNFDDFVQESAK